ncbi:MAG: hypothetical protein JNN15_16115 [Blastocatellia bacterium]|nr:hypothetical protein [Blastocatellia bacterium]
MSAKLTVIFYILICFEIGFLLLFLPWYSYWDDNFFIYYLNDRFHLPTFITFMQSGHVKGAVSGLGIINLMIGCWEIFNFRKNVKALMDEEDEHPKSTASKLSNNRPTNTQGK